MDNLGNGSTVKEINLQTLKNLKFRLTTIEEQRHISKVLSTWDKAIELKILHIV
ncbi:restriction endonuclease subunit S [Anaerosolibacter sp.]|uniref:restriction endonuclease subunit S n=1 Tax=Anaerosolibacter sp. TaxID=1872527 RepID=UPI0039F0DF4C